MYRKLSGFTNQRLQIKISKNDFSEEFLPSSNRSCWKSVRLRSPTYPVNAQTVFPGGSALGCGEQSTWRISMSKEAESHPCHAECWEFEEGTISCQHILFLLLRMQF